MSSIQSQYYYYEKKSLKNFKCGSNGNIVQFCLNYKFEVLDDFIFVFLNKKPMINDEFNKFYTLFLIKIHIDYFFNNPCDNYFNYDIGSIDNYLSQNNPKFVQNNIFDYLKNSYGIYTQRLNTSIFNPIGNNVVLSFKTMKLELDSNVLTSEYSKFYSFAFDNQKNTYSNKLFSVIFKLSPMIEIYKFKYKK